MVWNDKITSRIVSLALTALFFFSSVSGISFGKDKPDPTLETPLWTTSVHEHWVWENVGTQESAYELVTSFLDRGIPVGAVIIDYPWDEGIGSFIPSQERYPDLAEYINKFHDLGVRVMMWTTCMVNEDAPNFQEGKDKGYYISNGRTVKWWNGRGAFLDYSNPEAVDWFREQMDKVLDLGIDGWKVDGADPYIMLLIPATGKNKFHITWNQYQEMFYGEVFNYTREKLGKDAIVSFRPVDDVVLRAGLPLVFTSREINFAGWVGDQDNDWGGLRAALNNMMSSSRFNFVSYGSDIGGFRYDRDDEGKLILHKDVFLRWAQLGAFCPVMENGGGPEKTPWLYDNTGETLDIYKKFAILHNELIPYIYSQAAYSYELVQPTMRPQLGTYQYMLGDELLVAPLFEEGNSRTIVFPKGEWIYMFDESKTYTGGVRKLEFPLDEFPVFIRKGAIIPMEVAGDTTGFGSALSSDYTTVSVYPQKGSNRFGLYENYSRGSMLSYVKDNSSLIIRSTPSERSLLFRVCGEPTPSAVRLGGALLTQASSMAQLVTMPSGYFTENGITWIAVKTVTAGADIQVTY